MSDVLTDLRQCRTIPILTHVIPRALCARQKDIEMTTTTNTTTLNSVNIGAVGELVATIQDDLTKADTVWRSTVDWKGGFRSEARSRDFPPVPSDEPVGLGGDDSAPNPVEQVLGAFGNCLAVGYAANATVAGIELKSLRIELEGDLDLHTFLGLRDGGHAGFDSIKARVFIDSEASDEQIDDLHRKVVSTSPVGHTLQQAIPLDIELA